MKLKAPLNYFSSRDCLKNHWLFTKNSLKKSGHTNYFLKIKAILLLQRNEKNGQIIEKLQDFLELIQKRGSQFV